MTDTPRDPNGKPEIDPDMSSIARSVLDFWFRGENGTDLSAQRKVWFEKDAAFDKAIADGFTAAYERARDGALDALQESPEGCLALVILLDQFPRNLFRGDPRTFATDARARALARHAVDRGFDQQLPAAARMFLYLPFEHSEDLDDQHRCCALIEAMGNEELLKYAVKHRDIIARFGRFPHRNAVLGRTTTDEEATFLTQPGSSF
jgi:uncharacterized protein (DUF924 family)